MARHEDKRSKIEKIAAEIRALIMSGEWEPGRKIPSTDDLIKAHGTSNVTVQKALNVLKAEKLLEGRSGSGVYVREKAAQIITPASYMAPSDPGQPYRWTTEAANRGQRGSNKVLSVGEVTVPKRVADVLGVKSAVLRTRLGLLDDEPAEVSYSYYPADLARGTRLADRRRIPGGSPTLLAEMGYPAVEQVDEVGARPATTEEYELLEIPGDVPVLEVFRIVYSNDQRPVEVTVLVKPGHLYKMGYHLHVS